MYTLGIDIGSTATKAVILKDGQEIIKKALVSVGAGTSGPSKVFENLFSDKVIQESEIDRIIATGYGRLTFDKADNQISELTCHARGVHFLAPSTRTIIDIGGQDAKVLKLDSNGKLLNFVMNDKCAAGTGRFLDVMAGVLETSVGELGELSKLSQDIVKISSTCTVFAESEVISHLASGRKRADIIAGIHKSIAKRVGSLVFRSGKEEDVVMTGGVARNTGVVEMMEQVINTNIKVTEYPQFTGAIGAALLGFEEVNK